MLITHWIMIIISAIFVAWNGSNAYGHFLKEEYFWSVFNVIFMLWMLLIAKRHIDALTKEQGKDNEETGNEES